MKHSSMIENENIENCDKKNHKKRYIKKSKLNTDNNNKNFSSGIIEDESFESISEIEEEMKLNTVVNTLSSQIETLNKQMEEFKNSFKTENSKIKNFEIMIHEKYGEMDQMQSKVNAYDFILKDNINSVKVRIDELNEEMKNFKEKTNLPRESESGSESNELINEEKNQKHLRDLDFIEYVKQNINKLYKSIEFVRDDVKNHSNYVKNKFKEIEKKISDKALKEELESLRSELNSEKYIQIYSQKFADLNETKRSLRKLEETIINIIQVLQNDDETETASLSKRPLTLEACASVDKYIRTMTYPKSYYSNYKKVPNSLIVKKVSKTQKLHNLINQANFISNKNNKNEKKNNYKEFKICYLF